MTKRAVVVIPTYNEKENIARVSAALAAVFKSVDGYDMHILFVDDSSPDGTAAEITRIIAKYRFIHILRNKSKGGLGHAYKKGFRFAIDKLKAHILIEFDGDLSHDPTKIPEMLKQLEKGSDMVLGSRYMKGGGIPRNWGIHRKFLSVVGNFFIKVIMLNFKIHDWTGGYRAINKDVVENILPILRNTAFNGYTWQIGFLVKALQAGYTVSEVPFYFKDREKGYSKLGPEYLFNILRYIMKVRIDQILKSRIFKFVVVGGTGAVIQLTTLQVYRRFMPFQLAFFLSIETAIVSNFILSNVWTFADRKLKASQIPGKFLAFNLASGGSILIQQALAFFGEKFIGLRALFTLPIVNKVIDTGLMFAVTGIFIGMFWNFFAYSRIIWKGGAKAQGKVNRKKK